MESKVSLKKELGLIDIFCISSGAMISSGLFILPALAYAKTGPAVVFSYILAGILVLPTLLAKAELATAMPKAGGVYFFIERSMGTPLGTVGGLASWFSLSFKSAFALVGMGIFATLMNPSLSMMQIKLIAIGCCLFFMVVNIVGVKHTGRLQVLLVYSLIVILLLYVIRGVTVVQPERYVPFMPYNLSSVFASAGLVFVSFGGLTKVCCVAEEVKNPGRTLPLGMFLAFSVVMLLYAAVVFVTVGILDSTVFAQSLTPISDGAYSFMGIGGSVALAFAAMLAFVSTANAGILTASRDALAMSRDFLLPKLFHHVGSRFKTPHIAIIATTAFMIMVILFLSLENLVKTASTLMILLFIFVNLSLIVMRESKIQSYQPAFRVPLYPWLQIAGILGYAFLLVEMGVIPLATSGVFIICGFIWYLVYARTRVNRQSAIIHVVERITARELVDATLPDELKEIIIERDSIIEDRFDRLVKKCEIIDYDPADASQRSAEELFRTLSSLLAQHLSMDQEKLFNLFLEREKQASTVIAPGLAIPHIIVEGRRKFDIVLVRCKKGIVFPNVKEPVHALFVLIGSLDERNFHLRALAAIAQIVQGKDFDQNWLNARNTEELRHIMLLGKRRRGQKGR
jgi:amino acid transporter